MNKTLTAILLVILLACGSGDECETVVLECGDEKEKYVYTEAEADSYWLEDYAGVVYQCPQGADEVEDTSPASYYPDSCRAADEYGILTVEAMKDSGRMAHDVDLAYDSYVAFAKCFTGNYGSYITGQLCNGLPDGAVDIYDTSRRE